MTPALAYHSLFWPQMLVAWIWEQFSFRGNLYSVSYGSRALSPADGTTDLETLAIVWAVNHFQHPS